MVGPALQCLPAPFLIQGVARPLSVVADGELVLSYMSDVLYMPSSCSFTRSKTDTSVVVVVRKHVAMSRRVWQATIHLGDWWRAHS